MAVTLNASTSSGLVQTADTSGEINIQSNGTTVLGVTSTGIAVTGTQSVSGNLSFNSGYGSSAVAYGCRAWVNFDGTGTPTIRASGNVSSITDGGVGTYTINFTTAMPDANYSVSGAWGLPVVGGESVRINTAPTTNNITVGTSGYAAAYDPLYVTVSIFR